MTAAKVEKVAREMYRILADSVSPKDREFVTDLARWHLREIAKAERRGAEKAMHARIRVAAYNPAWTAVANPVTVKFDKGGTLRLRRGPVSNRRKR